MVGVCCGAPRPHPGADVASNEKEREANGEVMVRAISFSGAPTHQSCCVAGAKAQEEREADREVEGAEGAVEA